ncbi:MEKHLA domain-containing protein [Paraburkholderia sp.]|uniref:MEKHLA domain-containing protein n=1 Tax=Paraburkholderia sp. TaxID=1926495 RepID=UPI002F413528
MKLSTDPEFFQLLSESYERLLQRPLTPAGMSIEEAAQWLYESAPFGILAHNTDADPIFVYGNKTAQRLFDYSWSELTALPSRLSAEAPEREERRAFLEQVQRDGFVAGYRGIRVTRSGERFWIENAIVWQLMDQHGVYRGQAALLPETAPVASD